MSSKSKRKPKDVSMHKAVSIAMTIFVWAWMECFHPTQEDVNRMSDEVRNIRESVNSKNLNIWEVKDAIKDEFGWEYDAAKNERRDCLPDVRQDIPVRPPKSEILLGRVQEGVRTGVESGAGAADAGTGGAPESVRAVPSLGDRAGGERSRNDVWPLRLVESRLRVLRKRERETYARFRKTRHRAFNIE